MTKLAKNFLPHETGKRSEVDDNGSSPTRRVAHKPIHAARAIMRNTMHERPSRRKGFHDDPLRLQRLHDAIAVFASMCRMCPGRADDFTSSPAPASLAKSPPIKNKRVTANVTPASSPRCLAPVDSTSLPRHTVAPSPRFLATPSVGISIGSQTFCRNNQIALKERT
ncbi:hypothetical protein RRSWK_07194 [Rhodopirellula sp. SWK7]|nr:hypothetical protein RRSWK_07194 [Rhodopirellula sp. SWK7]